MSAIVSAGPVPQTTVVTPTSAYQMTLTEDWNIITDDASAAYGTSNPLFFIGDPLFPAIGTTHPRATSLRFETFNSVKQEAANKWVVSGMKYSTAMYADIHWDDRIDDTDAASLLKADRAWSFMTVEKAVERGYVADPTGATKFNRPITAGFSTDPEPIATKEVGEPILGITETKYIPVCSYVRNELLPPAALITDDLVGSVNNDAIVIDGLAVPAYTCLLEDIQISNQKQSLSSGGGTVKFRTVTYKLAINSEGWDLDVLNHGFYAIYAVPANPPAVPAATTAVQRIKVWDGVDSESGNRKQRPASTSQLLDVNGNWIDASPNTGSATWRDDVHYRVYRTKNYTSFAPFQFS